jgi:hypothetical protein
MLRDISVAGGTAMVIAAAIIAIPFFPDHVLWSVGIVAAASIAAACYFQWTGDDL